MNIYTIGVGSDFANKDSAAVKLLNTISTNGSANTTSNLGDLLDDIDNIITSGSGHYSNMTVTDTLSEYVDFCADDLDLKVQRVTKDSNGNGVKTDLYTRETLSATETMTTTGATYLDSVAMGTNTPTRPSPA